MNKFRYFVAFNYTKQGDDDKILVANASVEVENQITTIDEIRRIGAKLRGDNGYNTLVIINFQLLCILQA